SGNRPIKAMAFGHHVENRRGSWSSPLATLRITCADARRWEALSKPRSSSLMLSKVSASSIKKLGLLSSIARKIVDGLMFPENTGRGRKNENTVNGVLFPQPFSGEEKFKNGEIGKASMA